MAGESTTVQKSAIRRTHKWYKLVIVLIVALMGTGLAVYHIVTSAWFFKSVILPRVSRGVGAEITVKEAKIHPFSQIVLEGLLVKPAGFEPVFQLSTVKARYSLMRLLRGELAIDSLVIDSPEITIVRQGDGRSNIDPILNTLSGKPKVATPRKPVPPAPMKIDIGRVTISGGRITFINKSGKGSTFKLILEELQGDCVNLKNASTGTLSLKTMIRGSEETSNGEIVNSFVGSITNSIRMRISTDGQIENASVNNKYEVKSATGELAHLLGVGLTMVGEITTQNIQNLTIDFAQHSTPLGKILVYGPFNLKDGTGQITLCLVGISAPALELFAAPFGYKFGDTIINASNYITFANYSQSIATEGYVNVSKFSISRRDLSIPPMDFHANFRISYNGTTGELAIEKFEIDGYTNSKPLLQSRLTAPIKISRQTSLIPTYSSHFLTKVTDLDLGAWKTPISTFIPSGIINAQIELAPSTNNTGGTLNFATEWRGITLTVNSMAIQNLNGSCLGRLVLENLQNINIESLTFSLSRATNPLLQAHLAGQANLQQYLSNLKFRFEANLQNLSKLTMPPTINITSGTASLHGSLEGSLTNCNLAITGKLNSAKCIFLGQTLQPTDGEFSALVHRLGSEIMLKDLKLCLSQAGNSVFDLKGDGQLNTETRDITMKITVPVCTEPILTLATASLLKPGTIIPGNLFADAYLSKKGSAWESSITATVSNLLFKAGQEKFGPYNFGIHLASTGAGTTNFALTKGHFYIADPNGTSNAVTLTAFLQNPVPHGIQGSIKIAADRIDLTPYSKLIFQTRQPPAPAQQPPTQIVDPPPTRLPCANLEITAQMTSICLQEIDIKDLDLKVVLQPEVVSIHNLRCKINNAPLQADLKLDVGKPGYKYEFNLVSERLPLTPIINTFSTEYHGKATGELTAKADIRGQGLTGASLQKHLNGNLLLCVTNCTMRLIGQKATLLLTPLALALGIDDVLKASLTNFVLSVNLGQGAITIANCLLETDLFRAHTQGQIPIASELGNSRLNDLPIEIAIHSQLAQKSRLLPATALPSSNMVQLPIFAKLRGTLNKPEIYTDKAVIASFLAKSISTLPSAAATKTAEMLNMATQILQPSTNTNQPSTNPPALPFNPLEVLRRR